MVRYGIGIPRSESLEQSPPIGLRKFPADDLSARTCTLDNVLWITHLHPTIRRRSGFQLFNSANLVGSCSVTSASEAAHHQAQENRGSYLGKVADQSGWQPLFVPLSGLSPLV